MAVDDQCNWQEPLLCSHGYFTLELIEDQKCMLTLFEFRLLDVGEQNFLHVLNHGLLIGPMILCVSDIPAVRNTTVGRQRCVVPL